MQHTVKKQISRYLNSAKKQRGAMFGLDARIALGIFGALSIIAGAYTAMSMNDIHAKAFSKELANTASAIEAIHQDLKKDLHSALTDITDKNAFIALYDKNVIAEHRDRGRWLGPYITSQTPTHSRYGEIYITKRSDNIDQDCFPESTCYLWLSYDNVRASIAEALNPIFDGDHEATPDSTGRVQWRDGHDENKRILWFRTTRTMGGGGYN